jgi:hypothetical protein
MRFAGARAVIRWTAALLSLSICHSVHLLSRPVFFSWIKYGALPFLESQFALNGITICGTNGYFDVESSALISPSHNF